MKNNHFEILAAALDLYNNDLAKKLGVDLNSKYGREKLNKYLKNQEKSDMFNAECNLTLNNPEKVISYSQIISEANNIRRKRLEPYMQKAEEINKINEQQEQSSNNVNQKIMK